MDHDLELERALAASLADQESLEEDGQLQEAIRLSRIQMENENEDDIETETASGSETQSEDENEDNSGSHADLTPNRKATNNPSIADHPRETNTAATRKRKADEQLSRDTIKSSPDFKPSIVPPQASPAMAYPNGGIRITRTPGRKTAKNCVNLKDLIHKDQLISACIFSFYIADDELFPHLPLSHSSNAKPIYIGRDANMDSTVLAACHQAGVKFKGKLSNKQLQNLTPSLRQINIEQYGKNFHAFYAWSPGSSHSKILVLMYPTFLRLVITSCNMMDIDTVLGDNHWYIHDLPKLAGASQKAGATSGFETDFLAHLQALGVPGEFIGSIRGKYDYSTVKVHLVTSVPGTCAGPKAEQHGLLRLRRVVQDLDLQLPKKESKGELRLELCAASIGNLSTKWLGGFSDCALGMKTLEIADANCDLPVPDMKLFYPTVGDVRSANASSQQAASNIGCHTRPWDKAPDKIKHIFHHYESKDTGRLFHQKLIMAYNPKAKDTTAPPYYVYLGSANLSQSAWGALEPDKKGNGATCNVKLVKTSNFECGVVVPGHLVEGLLAPGTSWQDIVPYVQTAKKYDLVEDRPWNDPRWVKDRREDSEG